MRGLLVLERSAVDVVSLCRMCAPCVFVCACLHDGVCVIVTVFVHVNGACVVRHLDFAAGPVQNSAGEA